MHFTTLTTLTAFLAATPLIQGSIIGPEEQQDQLLAAYCQDMSTDEHTHFPTEDDHNMGAREVCDSFYGGASTKDVTNKEKNIATVTLQSYDNKGTIAWVYEMAFDGKDGKQTVSHDTCVSEFVNVVAEGVLGANYCVPNQTETVLSLGGIRIAGNLRFEVRKKRGT